MEDQPIIYRNYDQSGWHQRLGRMGAAIIASIVVCLGLIILMVVYFLQINAT